MLPNYDNKTGIHYGVIQARYVDYWHEEEEPHYTNTCPYCGSDLEETFDFYDNIGKKYPCCNKEVKPFDGEGIEPDYWYIDNGTYQATANYNSDDDIFVIKSQYYTLCSPCSPCAPNAGYIMDQNKEGIKAYCFGLDMFDEENAPYDIYSVETGKLIYKV